MDDNKEIPPPSSDEPTTEAYAGQTEEHLRAEIVRLRGVLQAIAAVNESSWDEQCREMEWLAREGLAATAAGKEPGTA